MNAAFANNHRIASSSQYESVGISAKGGEGK
jgi:hypothetical protein